MANQSKRILRAPKLTAETLLELLRQSPDLKAALKDELKKEPASYTAREDIYQPMNKKTGKPQGEPKPTVKFEHSQNPMYGFSLGLGKVNAILDNLDLLKAFAKKHKAK